MATQPIDYTALAKQYGATSSTPAPAVPKVDYAALAKQFGGTSAASGPTPPVDLSNVAGAQGPLPTPPAHPAVAALSGTSSQPGPGFVGSAWQASGIPMLPHALRHPIDTASAMVNNTTDNVKQGISDYQKSGLSDTTRRDFGRAVPIVGPALATAQAQHDAGNDAGMAGTLAGTVGAFAGPKLLKEAPGVAGGAMVHAGEGMQDAGVGLLNKTVGTLNSDFKRGANPAQGYFDAGFGPSMSMQSIASKAAKAKEATGEKLGGLYDSATDSGVKIPTTDVRSALQRPLAKAINLETGPGGMGNIAPLENYANGFKPAIQDADANGGFTPRGLFDMKRNIAQNTNWSDPTQFNLKAVRQQQTGGLSGLLTQAVPETEQLNSLYGNVGKLAARAQSRAETGSSPLTTLAGKLGGGALGAGLGAGHGAPAMLAATAMGLGLDSIPVKTSVASGLYYGGKGLAAAGGKVRGLFGSAEGAEGAQVAQAAQNPQTSSPQMISPGRQSLYLPEPDYTQGGFPTRESIVTPPPPSPLRLPANAGSGQVQPMVGIKAYPPLAEPFARERIAPTTFNSPESIPEKGFVSGSQGLYGKRLEFPGPKPLPKSQPATLPNVRLQQLLSAAKGVLKRP